ncbi:TIGR03087 family PEP-CTERM/XrtA system glycosyltransferase [Aestuariibacter halophilus]|uniref:TIGR03087 family PEP-CTERM/XrtA system glycosyltransferase n=1 Tax=Fluctibacter halophilus TaxID=226011 RepID=A0ABS8G429_9ALTE|nr:TIGR03087 family PEP-CTERM/XrtA system glycosyltransferase [Aestuariibacter halophilus]MCC2614856.1 TIGR03087 family PEP-CTERM/XrtA system glycosyltransferase [Aestuariibacter halophilus]
MAQKEALLFLCHRIPFPPNKGDKIRSFNVLKALSEHYDIYLGTFVDDPYDWQYAETLNDFCTEVCLLGQNKLWCKIKGLTSLLTGKSISEPYYYDRKMARWVDDVVRSKGIKKVFVFSSPMAQYINHYSAEQLTSVVDFVDVDSDKWRQYAEGKTGLSRWVYAREQRKLLAFEIATTARASHAIFVSPQEAALFQGLIPQHLRDKVHGVLNGVDTTFFDPQAKFGERPLAPVEVVFTGAMDYWANVDAVLWFVRHVWPRVRETHPEALFTVVGGNPSTEIEALDGYDGITVTGRVKDIRPYIANAKVVVAPLQIARGIQNKVLEGMSLEKPVVATSMADEGIESGCEHVRVEDTPDGFAEAVRGYLDNPVTATENRAWIMQHLQWSQTLSVLPEWIGTD